MRRTEALEALRASPAFDARWYAATHPDVAASGLDPAEHYLRLGAPMGRDPSPGLDAGFHRIACRRCRKPGAVPALCHGTQEPPSQAPIDPDHVLLAAATVAAAKGPTAGAALAEAHLPPALAHTALLLRANAALERGDEAGWADRVNAYLGHAGGLGVAVQPGPEPAFFRLAPARPPRPVSGGPLVSVLMPAHDAEATIAVAGRSILDQSWRNLELVVVDDASTDGTWRALRDLAAADDRVRPLRNPFNAGPYVAKNLALRVARGEWITGHDADDWAHPERIARHVAAATGGGAPVRASVPHMLRIHPDGAFSFLGRPSTFSPDGASRRCLVAAMFSADLLREELGFWDSVRFGADSEMISRAAAATGGEITALPQVSMFCLDLPTSLTNLAGFGLARNSGGLSPVRSRYRDAWRADHARRAGRGDWFLPFPQRRRRVAAPAEMGVPVIHIAHNISAADEAAGGATGT